VPVGKIARFEIYGMKTAEMAFQDWRFTLVLHGIGKMGIGETVYNIALTGKPIQACQMKKSSSH